MGCAATFYSFRKSQSEMNLKYPIGVQSFPEMIEGGYAYVDKTGFLYRLVSENKYYFLSRPRRFGKSLLLSTLEEYFRGSRHLFQGLAIDRLQPGEWESHPVLHFDLNTEIYTAADSLEKALGYQLRQYEKEYGVTPESQSVTFRFNALIRQVFEQSRRQVVILVDEYDKPMVDAAGDPMLEHKNRQTLRGFYGVMKSNDSMIRFAILSGVGKIGNYDVFSGLNQLRDISIVPEYSAICGITEEELRNTYEPGVEEFARQNGCGTEEAYSMLREMYAGYHFSIDLVDVYNPFSVLNALANKMPLCYWYYTGTPTFLIKRLESWNRPLSDIEGYRTSVNSLINPDIADNRLVNTLYYAGYLTIKSVNRSGSRFIVVTLGFPNGEVREGFINNVLCTLTQCDSDENGLLADNMLRMLDEGNVDEFMHTMQGFFSRFPYDLSVRNESHYQDVLFAVCMLLGCRAEAEVKTSEGRIDMVVQVGKTLYIMEFKLNASPEEALRQIDMRHYSRPYILRNFDIVKVGVNFSSATRNIDRWKVDSLSACLE